MRSGLILILVLVFYTASIKSRIAGLYTYWWFGIFRPHEWVWNPMISNMRLPLIAAILLILPSLLEKKTPKLDHPIAILMLLWLALAFIADLLNGCSDMHMVRTNTVLGLFILIYIVLLSCEITIDYKTIFWLITVIAISISFHSGKDGIYALISGANNYGSNNLSGLFSGSNAYALGSGMLLFFVIFTFQQVNTKLILGYRENWYSNPLLIMFFKISLIVAIIGILYNIISLQSRGAFISTCLGLIIWIILQKRGVIVLITASLILIVSINYLPLPEGYVERISSAFAEEEELDISAASRPHFWKTAREMVADHPLGVGPGCFPAYYDQYDTSNGLYGNRRSVHSSHFQILSDSGYLGIIIWILLFMISYWKLFKIRKLSKTHIKDKNKTKYFADISCMLLCCQSVFLIGGSFYEYAYNDIIWLVLALVITVDKKLNNEINPSNAVVKTSA